MKHAFVLLLITLSLALRASGPTANKDSISLFENQQALVPVLANDVNPGGGPLTITIAFAALNGVANVSGNQVLYTPQHGFFGIDSFKYQICDTFNNCSSAEVYLNVRGGAAGPIVSAYIYTFADTATTVALNVLLADTDPNHDTLYVGAVYNIDTTTNIGTLSIDSATGLVVFNHTALTCGQGTFAYTGCNPAACDTALITINVTCPDSIFLPQGFSPNGDGKNDNLVFPGLEYFSPATLTVFNRYGTIVYTNTNYLNDWNGTELDSGHALPDGTYYYVLKLASGRSYNNFLVINR